MAEGDFSVKGQKQKFSIPEYSLVCGLSALTCGIGLAAMKVLLWKLKFVCILSIVLSRRRCALELNLELKGHPK